MNPVRTGLQSPLAHEQPLSQVKATLIRQKTTLHRHIPSDDRAGLARSRVELRRFLLHATYRRCVQRCDCGCGESMCGVLVVHYLHSASSMAVWTYRLLLSIVRCVRGAHETVFDSHDVAFVCVCVWTHVRTCVYACVPVCVRTVVLLLAVEQNI